MPSRVTKQHIFPFLDPGTARDGTDKTINLEFPPFPINRWRSPPLVDRIGNVKQFKNGKEGKGRKVAR